MDGRPQTPAAAVIESPLVDVDGPHKIRFQWQDEFGLAGKEPFTLTVTASDDEAPLLACEDLPRSKVVLDSEQLNFRVKAEDDFGVKQIGIEWQGADDAGAATPAKGERILAAGGFDKRTVEAVRHVLGAILEIEPQPIHLRVFTVDYFPGRERVYSPAYVLYVLNAEQHAVWITEQLNKWHRQALEVRDREMQLHETNKQLRDLSPEELDRPDTRRRIENQAAAERANGRRLTGLTAAGEDLLRQAARNPQFDVGSLDRWAEMLQILKDIAGNRMPSVADLLGAGIQSSHCRASRSPRDRGRDRCAPAGRELLRRPDRPQNSRRPRPFRRSPTSNPRCSRRGKSAAPQAAAKKPVVAQSAAADDDPHRPARRKPAKPANPGGREDARGRPSATRPVGRIREDRQRVEQHPGQSGRKHAGQTAQGGLPGTISRGGTRRRFAGGFLRLGLRRRMGASAEDVFAELSEVETKSSQNVSMIMDDLQAYFERRRFLKFKTVLDEMKSQDVIGGLRQVADELPNEPGLSIAQCEYWWDTLDRWAEDLVDPAVQRNLPGLRLAGQPAAVDRAGSTEGPGRGSQSARRDPRGRAGAAGHGEGPSTASGPASCPTRKTAWSTAWKR